MERISIGGEGGASEEFIIQVACAVDPAIQKKLSKNKRLDGAVLLVARHIRDYPFLFSGVKKDKLIGVFSEVTRNAMSNTCQEGSSLEIEKIALVVSEAVVHEIFPPSSKYFLR